jgi:hypothetical protein
VGWADCFLAVLGGCGRLCGSLGGIFLRGLGRCEPLLTRVLRGVLDGLHAPDFGAGAALQVECYEAEKNGFNVIEGS